jgi:hypothetical protein
VRGGRESGTWEAAAETKAYWTGSLYHVVSVLERRWYRDAPNRIEARRNSSSPSPPFQLLLWNAGCVFERETLE